MVEAMAVRRVVGSVNAVSVERAGPQTRQVAVPDFVGEFGQRVTRDLAPSARVEDAQVDALGVGGEEREVDAGAVPVRAERIGAARFEAFRHRHYGTKTIAASAGSVSASECSRPCMATGSVRTAPKLPSFPPP